MTQYSFFPRAVAYSLSASLLFQSCWVSAAVVVDITAPASEQAQLDQASNGVTIVNIADPSAQGVSHNTFTQFDVDQQGIILNNSQALVNTQLGGWINSNGQLSTQSASLILNEVTGPNRSQLNGFTEIAGAQANYVLANPYGITCNGCGFINTPRVSLTTGVPELLNGQLNSISVSQGDILIEGLGLNASNVSQLDIITRAATLNANLHAQTLNVITGSQTVDYSNLAISNINADDGNSPAFALDSSVLGGMYANSIRLVGTEAGVGVRMAGDMAASVGELIITQAGDIQLAGTSSNTNLALSAQGDIHLTDNVQAEVLALNASNTITVDTVRVDVTSDINVQANNLVNQGIIDAGDDLAITLTGTLDNRNALLTAATQRLQANHINNSQGTIFSSDTLQISVNDSVDNSAGLISAIGTQDLLITAGGLLNNTAGTLETNATNLTLSVGELNNQNGLIQHAGAGSFDLLSDTALNNQQGSVLSNGDLSLQASAVDNSTGSIVVEGDLHITSNTDISNTNGTLESGGDIQLVAQSGDLDNSNGTLISTGTGAALLQAAGSVLNNNGNLQLNATDLTLTALAGNVSNTGGFLLHAGAGDFVLGAETVNNNAAASLLSGGNLLLSATDFNNNSSELFTVNDANLSLNSLLNTNGSVRSGNTLTLGLVNGLLSGGELNASSTLTINSNGHFTNATGNRLITSGNLLINSSGQLTNAGELSTLGDLFLSGTTFTNSSNAIVSAGDDLALNFGQLINQSGARLSAGQDLTLSGSSLTNEGIVAAGRDLSTQLSANLDNYNTLFAGNNASLYAANQLTNYAGANIFAVNDVTLAANAGNAKNARVRNSSGTIEAYSGDMFIATNVLENIDALPTISTSARTVGVVGGVSYFTYRPQNGPPGADGVDDRGYDGSVALAFADGYAVLDALRPDDLYVFETYVPDLVWDEYWSFDTPNRISRIQLNTTLYTESADLSQQAPASLVSGGNLTVQANDILNRVSLIAADGTITMTGNSLTNQGLELYETATGSWVYSTQKKDESTQYAGSNGLINGAVVIGNVASTITAGGNFTGSFTGQIDNSSIRQQQGGSAANNQSQSANTSAAGGIDPTGALPLVVGNQQDLGPVVYNPANGLQLPDNDGLFVTRPNPSALYLVETNPLFTGYTNFIGSDYFLNQLTIDPEITSKRLGDAFYENRLMREAIFSTTGQRYLINQDTQQQIADDREQMLYLMNNALDAERTLNLSAGISLTLEQMHLLTHDILWMEEQEVAGQLVLVPVYYAASLQDTAVLNGAAIMANAIDLTGDSLTNQGVLSAGDTLVLDSNQDLINQGALRSGGNTSLISREGSVLNEAIVASQTLNNGNGSFTTQSVVSAAPSVEVGGDLVISSADDIRFRAATVTVAGDLQADAGQDIQVVSATAEETVFTDVRNRSNSVTQVGSTLTVGGNAALSAGNDITVQASEISAEGNLSATAGNDINISSLADESNSERYRRGDGSTRQSIDESIAQQASTLNAGNNLDLNAGNDLTISGSDVIASNNISLDASNDLLIESTQEESYSYLYQETEESFGRSSESTEEEQRISNRASTVVAGGNVALSSGADTKVVASNIAAQNTIEIEAGGDIRLLSAEELNSRSSESSSTGVAGLSSEREGQLDSTLTQVGSTLSTQQGDIRLDSGSNITIVASELESAQDITLVAFDQLDIASANEQTINGTFSDDSGFFTGGSFYQQDIEQDDTTTNTSRGANVTAARDIIVDAGAARVIGSELNAGNDISVSTDIGAIEILTAEENSNNEFYSRQVEANLNFSGLDSLKIEDGQIKSTLGDATYDLLESSSNETNNSGSTLRAGNNLVLESVGDIQVSGSTLVADSDASGAGTAALLAEGDIAITAATNTFASETEEVHGEAEVSIVVQHQAVEIVKAVAELADANDQLKEAQADKRRYEKSLEKLKGELAELEQAYANNEPGAHYGDLIELRELVKEVEDDESWYDTGIIVAAAHVTTATILVAQQITAAANSAQSYAFGFNAGVQFDVEGSKTETSTFGTSSVASSISGNNIVLQNRSSIDNENTNQLFIQGSQLAATDILAIDTDTLLVEASRDTFTRESSTESASLNIGVTLFGASSGATVSGSYGRDRDKDKTTQYTNSLLTGDTVFLNTTGDTSITGGNIRANNELIALIGGDLLLESQQNRSSGSNNSVGVSAGFSLSEAEGGQADSRSNPDGTLSSAVHNPGNLDTLSAVNGGANSANGFYQEKQTVLSSITSGGTADITVDGDTQIVGALIATLDEDGNDLGNLTLSTNTLSYTDLSESSYSESRSAGINANIGLLADEDSTNPLQTVVNPNQNAKDEDGVRVNTSHTQYSNASSYSKGQTLATIGQGTLIINDEEDSNDLTQLNRDITAVTNELFSIDRQEGDINLTLDHRLLSEDGREEVVRDIVLIGQNIQLISQGVPSASDNNEVLASIGEFLNNIGKKSAGIIPSEKNSGGLLGQMPILLGSADNQAGAFIVAPEDSDYVLAHPDEFLPASSLPFYATVPEESKLLLEGQMVSIAPVKITEENATYQNTINGLNNTLTEAIVNGMQQADATLLTQHYNPSHGMLGDLLESGIDVGFGKFFSTGISRQTGESLEDAVISNGAEGTNIVPHSQAGIIVYSGLNYVGKEGFMGFDIDEFGERVTIFANGSAVSNTRMQNITEDVGITFSGSNVHEGDAVGEVVGGNQGLYLSSENTNIPLGLSERINRLFDFKLVFTGDKYEITDAAGNTLYDENGEPLNKVSPHSTYLCIINCGNESPWENDEGEDGE
ncbi:hemagglutinin repeat-containing protein [Gammaproteobacteria bacterium]|nr:hemagglutinin repeat-containing protein [Gammaproteobacteria bacterium]